MREMCSRNSDGPSFAPAKPGATLRRKCSCGGSSGAGDCEECSKKKTMQRSAGRANTPAVAPRIVHDALRSPGAPLGKATLAFMEPRFGHNFSNVRVHTDSLANSSARAVDALAFTVENNIVFGEGQFAPHSQQGRQLLGHELTHVVQQERSGSSVSRELTIGPADDPLEHQADRTAASLHGTIVTPDAHSPSVRRLQRTTRTPSNPAPDAGAPTPPVVTPPAPAPPAAVCGPDVTTPVGNVIAAMNGAWGGWNANQKEEACWSLQHASCGPVAWDIVELHNNAWIYQDYRPACATAGATPPCGSTVRVGTDCHFAGSVNYVIFGRMCKLCDIWPLTMRLMIRVHKQHVTGVDPDYAPAVAWAEAGYNGWPSVGIPAGDRNSCRPACATPFAATANLPAGAFDFHWTPSHTTETEGAACEDAVRTHRVIRDNPVEPGDFGP